MCSFRDKDLELSYQTQYFSQFKKTVIRSIVAVMAVFILFFIPDIVYFVNIGVLIRSIAIRLSSIVLFVILFYVFGKSKNSHSYFLTINAMELSFIVFYLLILSNYSNMNFIIKCMDIIVIITFYFSFPNRWDISILTSLSLILSFAVFCACNTRHFTQDSSYGVGAIYIGIAFSLNAINAYRINYYKRSQFYNIMVLKKLVNTDTLTGAFTRAKFNEDIGKQVSISKQTGRSFAIAIFDIDDFKHINDTYGHIEGDGVLTGIVNIVTKNKRPKDVLTRWGGEEFVVIFPSTGLSTAVRISERLRIDISTTIFSIGERVTCSFGVTEFEQNDTPISLMRRADKLMYEAKTAGKNTVVSKAMPTT